MNTVALKYFKDNYHKYPLEDLKKEALSKGCSQADIDEVLMMLGIKADHKSFSDKAMTVPVSEVLDGSSKGGLLSSGKGISAVKSIAEKLSIKKPDEKPGEKLDKKLDKEIESSSKVEGGDKGVSDVPSPKDKVVSGQGGLDSKGRVGAKWMKVSGILGIVFLVLVAAAYGASFFGLGDFFTSEYMFGWIGFVLLGVVAVFVYFWFFGFLKMGKAVGVKTLEVASVLNVVMVVVIVALLVLLVSGGLSFVSSGSEFPTFSEMVNGGVGSLILLVSVSSLVFIVRLTFSIGLVLVGDNVSLAKISGIFGIVAAVLAAAVFGVMSYFVMNPVPDMLSSDSPVYSISLVALGLILLLLESLVLFSGSKKFEV